MAILNLAQIMAAPDVTTKEVPVEEWGGEVVVKSISHRTMKSIREKVSDDEGNTNREELEKFIFIEGLIQPQVSAEEYELLLDKSTAAMNKILAAIMGSSKADKTAVTDAEKSVPSESVGVHAVPSSGETGEDGSGSSDG